MTPETESCLIAITNRHYIQGCDEAEKSGNMDLFHHLYVKKLLETASGHPKAIILREKDMEEKAYFSLVRDVISAFEEKRISVPLFLHTFYKEGQIPGTAGIHLPLTLLKQMSNDDKRSFERIGTSVHSLQDVQEAEQYGASYCFAGNIWETTCKPGKKAAGLDFLKKIVQASSLPVYAIGGITPEKIPAVLNAGAAGACMMSGFFKTDAL